MVKSMWERVPAGLRSQWWLLLLAFIGAAVVAYVSALGPAYAQTMATTVVGLAVAFIAWRQWQTAKHKLMLDLFEKRFELYNSTMIVIQQIDERRELDSSDISKMLQLRAASRFLFGQEVQDELVNAQKAVGRFFIGSLSIRDSNYSKKSKVEFEADITDAIAFARDFEKKFPALCEKYMKIEVTN